MVDAHQVTLESSSGSGAVRFLIYSAHTSSVTFPLLATQYPLPHKCWDAPRQRTNAIAAFEVAILNSPVSLADFPRQYRPRINMSADKGAKPFEIKRRSYALKAIGGR